MKIIFDGDISVKKILGTQKYIDTKDYKINKYVIKQNINDGILLYNLLTCEMLYLSDIELETKVYFKRLVNKWFILPLDCNEKELTDIVRTKLKGNKENLSKYVIFTTTACNARCFYCFEKGHQNFEYMSAETARKVSNFIATNSSEELIHFSWFGGEPLLNTEIITDICEQSKDNGLNFYSSIVTNCYLFSPKLINVAKQKWNLKWAQVTIDGTKENYNSIKNYQDIHDDPYTRVMNNIENLLINNIIVVISLRVSPVNGEDLLDLVSEISDRFGKYKNLQVLCPAIHEKNAGELCRRSQSQEEQLRDYQIKILDKLYEENLFKGRIQKKLRIYHCNSDSGKEITILPSGDIGWCNNYIDKNFIGHIDEKNFDEKRITSFHKKYDDLEYCTKCSLYPCCSRLKICDGSTEWCTVGNRKVTISQIKYSMLNEYLIFNKNQRNT